MKKIMFNDKYGLTQAVLEGKKTQTRRIIRPNSLTEYIQYPIGSIVAIAQSYEDCGYVENDYITRLGGRQTLEQTAGWSNKMFVKAKLMPHHIKITDVRVERLQDISDEDCMAEGIEFYGPYYGYRIPGARIIGWRTAQIAYSVLIDNVTKRGTWDSNPYVFVYEFKLID